MKMPITILIEATEMEKTSTESQEKQISRDLERGRKITPMSALTEYNCMRLGARIYDLKRKGMQIKTNIVELANGKRIAQYSRS